MGYLRSISILCCAALASSAFGQAMYQSSGVSNGDGGGGGNCGGWSTGLRPAPVFAGDRVYEGDCVDPSLGPGGGRLLGAATSSAGPGSLRATVEYVEDFTPSPGTFRRANASARMTFSDLFLATSSGANTVNVTLNLVLTASGFNSTVDSDANDTVRITILTGVFPFVIERLGSIQPTQNQIPGFNLDGIPVNVSIGSFALPANGNTGFSVIVTADDVAGSGNPGSLEGRIGATLSFPPGTEGGAAIPVFTVPDGVTVNCPSAGIVDNFWNQTDPPCSASDLASPYGVLDLGDIGVFTSGFLGNDPVADLTGDGIFDLADIGAFIDGFVGGCP